MPVDTSSDSGSRVDPRTFVHCIDRTDKLTFVNEAWIRFARENDADKLVSTPVTGRLLWEFIVDDETKELYRAVLGRTRNQQVEVRFPYRCDGPDRRRYMEMVMTPLTEGEVKFTSRLLREEPRDPVRLLEAETPRSADLIKMCGWCKKISTPEWMEVEEAIRRLGLLELSVLPKVSHGICPNCSAEMRRAIAKVGK